MEVNIIEIINVFIVILLLLIVALRRDTTTLLLVLFTYGALHFSFAAITLTSKDSGNILILQHIDGGGILAKLTALLFLGVVFLLLGRQA